jgi:hypothetical protein
MTTGDLTTDPWIHASGNETTAGIKFTPAELTLADIVSFSAAIPSMAAGAVIPLHLIRFEPQTLAVSPQADAAGQLLLDLATDLEEDTEYWAEIVIAGAEVRRIPLVVEIVSGTA